MASFALRIRMGTRLLESFGTVYRLLEQPRAARRAVVGLLVIHTFLLGYSAYVHSPTLNEPGHLVAGLSHWKFGRFDVYNVNPPLVKMVAALPVMVVGYNEDWSSFYADPGARPEMAMGEDFVKANGKRSFFLFMIARWACIPFSWLGAIICYLWARDLFGGPSGVLACAIWCVEPNILAHASLITPDAHATALGLAACYTFWRWLKHPTWSQAALTGVVLGLAELAKTTLILFYPLWPFMWLIYRLATPRSQLPAPRYFFFREACMLALRMAIGLYILNLGYAFEGSLTPLKDFHFVSDLFTGREARVESQEPDSASSRGPAPSPPSVNRFANTWLGHAPVPFPQNYLLGIDLQQKDFEHYGRPSYLRGVWRDRGWWYYYLYACAIKVPLGLWALGLLALFLSLRERLGGGQRFHRPVGEGQGEGTQSNTSALRLTPYASRRDLFILLFPPLVIFTVVSSKTGFSEHMRYVLPSFPFFFIAISGVGRLLRNSKGVVLTTPLGGVYCERSRRSWRFRFVPLFSVPLVGVLSSWLFASSLWIYPHSLSYFNEAIGGPLNGASHLLGSNVDWGQDLVYLNQWIANEATPGATDVASTATYDLRDLGLNVGALRTHVITATGSSPSETRTKWAATSVNFFLEARVADTATILNGPDAYSNIGYSIRVFQNSFDAKESKP